MRMILISVTKSHENEDRRATENKATLIRTHSTDGHRGNWPSYNSVSNPALKFHPCHPFQDSEPGKKRMRWEASRYLGFKV
eukprot:scaffold281090_cov37-Prasinocladus_malaysianus.AAC.1